MPAWLQRCCAAKALFRLLTEVWEIFPAPTIQTGSSIMLRRITSFLAFFLLTFSLSSAWADEYDNTIAVFKKAKESGAYFAKSYGYAVFPTIGKAGFVVGGSYGEGHVYEHGKYVGDTSLAGLSAGFQLGGEAYSQIIFFADKRAFDEFTSGNFEFGAQAQAVAITAGGAGGRGATGASGAVRGGGGV